MNANYTDKYQVVVLECPYNFLVDNKTGQKLFIDYVSFKLKGYLQEHAHGVLPLNAYDYFANIVILCEKKGDGLHPVMCFKSVTSSICKYFNHDFEIFGLFSPEMRESEQYAQVRNICARAEVSRKDIGYNSSWTIDPSFRADPALKMFAREASVALFVNYYKTYGISEILIGGLVRFKVDKVQAYLGFDYLKSGDKVLPPVECPFVKGEMTQIMHLTKFNPEVELIASQYSQLWESRLTLSGSNVHEWTRKDAA